MEIELLTIETTKKTACFCGDDNYDTLSENYLQRIVLCKKCGIVRANPYPVDCDIAMPSTYWKDAYKEATINTYSLHDFLYEYFDFRPKVVFDVGHNMEGWLEIFTNDGIEVHEGSIDDLIKIGKKADFIILSNMIERFSDIESSLLRIKELLNPDGMLYVGTPGFYSAQFQDNQVYQFTGDTLGYVMQCCGFDEYYVDDMIHGFYVKSNNKRSKNLIDKKVSDGIRNYLSNDRKEIPNIRTINKFTFKHRKNSIDKILSYNKPDVSEIALKVRDGKAIVVGGGPSTDEFIEEIKKKQVEGAKLFVIERMYSWAFENGIIPDYVVVLDASDDVPDSFKNINPDSVHIIATQANPIVMDILKDHKVYVFNTVQKGINSEIYWKKYGYEKVAIVNGGGSVTLCAFALAMTLGYPEIDMFGFDCHFTNGDYAKGIEGVGVQKNILEIEVNGKMFKTTTAYLSFAQQFFMMHHLAHKQGLISQVRVWGNSLIKSMARPNAINLSMGDENVSNMGDSIS